MIERWQRCKNKNVFGCISDSVEDKDDGDEETSIEEEVER